MSIARDFSNIAAEIAALETDNAAYQAEVASLRAEKAALLDERDRLLADLTAIERDARHYREVNIVLVEAYRSFRGGLIGSMVGAFTEMDNKIGIAFPKIRMSNPEAITQQAAEAVAEADDDEPRAPGPQHDATMRDISESLHRLVGITPRED